MDIKDQDPADLAVASGITVVTQALKPIFPDAATKFIPILPLFISFFWVWADERVKSPVVNWGLVIARSIKISVASLGIYAGGKQLVKKENVIE